MDVKSSAIMDVGGPRSAEVARLLKRISVIRWFRAGPIRPECGPQLAQAIESHLDGIGAERPACAEVLQSEVGARALLNGEIAASRPQWDGFIQAPFQALRDAALQSGRLREHPFLVVSGEAILVRPNALPLSQAALWSSLSQASHLQLPNRLLRILADRVLWELGMMVLHETLEDLMGENPYSPLLTLYEEGIYPLDLVSANRATLWTPGEPAAHTTPRISS